MATKHNRLNDLNALEEARAEKLADQSITDLYRPGPKAMLLGACAYQLYSRDVAAGEEPPQTFEDFMASRDSEDIARLLFVGDDEDDEPEPVVPLEDREVDDDTFRDDRGAADAPGRAEGDGLPGDRDPAERVGPAQPA